MLLVGDLVLSIGCWVQGVVMVVVVDVGWVIEVAGASVDEAADGVVSCSLSMGFVILSHNGARMCAGLVVSVVARRAFMMSWSVGMVVWCMTVWRITLVVSLYSFTPE